MLYWSTYISNFPRKRKVVIVTSTKLTSLGVNFSQRQWVHIEAKSNFMSIFDAMAILNCKNEGLMSKL